jgi:hypothetical protein
MTYVTAERRRFLVAGESINAEGIRLKKILSANMTLPSAGRTHRYSIDRLEDAAAAAQIDNVRAPQKSCWKLLTDVSDRRISVLNP